MQFQPFNYTVDMPALNQVVSDLNFAVRGWITAQKNSKLENPRLYNQDRFICALGVIDRPDVQRAFPDQSVLGFHKYLSVDEAPALSETRIEFLLDQQAYSFPITINFSYDQAEKIKTFREQKQAKLEKIRATLRCSVCGNEALQELIESLNCAKCGSNFGINQRNYNFLTQDLKLQNGVEATESVSANSYDETAQKLIERFPDGLILDNGSGLRNVYYSNVINLEIVDYTTTDVLGVGESLPFKSNVFDAVFSLAVLEHVKNPFECANEIARVLKPGGVLYAAVPFLQPFHGYPNHYYNMTSSGLKNLFSQTLEIVEYGVPQSGVPIWSLSWFLNSYLAGLPLEVAEQFKNMKVSELATMPPPYLATDFVTKLSPKVNEELACVNFLIATKPTLTPNQL